MALDETKIARDGLSEIAAAIRYHRDGQRGRIVFSFGPFSDQNQPVTLTPEFTGPIKGDLIAMTILKANQKAGFSLVITDAKGNPASVQNPVFTVTDPALLALTVNGDGLSGEVSAVGPVGVANLNFTGDADLGDGVKEISATAELQIFAGDAAIVAINIDTPVEQ